MLCDAAEEGIVVGAYSGFLKSDSTWSCNNILGRGLLAPEEWTITRKELGALNVASDVKAVVERALGDWLGSIYVGGDSELRCVGVLMKT